MKTYRTSTLPHRGLRNISGKPIDTSALLGITMYHTSSQDYNNRVLRFTIMERCNGEGSDLANCTGKQNI